MAIPDRVWVEFFLTVVADRGISGGSLYLSKRAYYDGAIGHN